MRRGLRLIGIMCLLLALAGGGIAVWAVSWFRAPGPLAVAKTIVIDRGARLESIGAALGDAGIIDHPPLFAPAAWLTRERGEIKAGEYAVVPAISPEGVLDLLRSGKTIMHRLVVPEGLTTAEIIGLIEHGEALSDAVTAPPGEGEIEPDTYFYSYGDKRQGLIDRMKRAQQRVLAELWAARDPEIPLYDPEEAVILASIVEKETAVPAERSKIAAVFYNRLRLGMKLQADPTVAYAVTGGRHPLDRALAKPDLDLVSPYNTYQVKGLPPGPIANPGRAALQAVLKPDHSDALYFVADGSGGHAFAATLDEHNKNVARWRQTSGAR
jgi:UPF0755 protein